MNIALVTGAETPLGLRLIQRLVRQGYRVHGIGNDFSKVTFADSQFIAHPVDLSNLAAVSGTMEEILEEEKSLDLLIHAIDVTPGAAFEKLSVGNLEAVLKIGLLGPVMLTRFALPNLLRFRGQLINVIPANKSGSRTSAVNALLEGGLREMNRALFDGARDAGLRITNLILRQNPEPDTLAVQSSEQTRINLEDVARAVEQLIDPNFANVPAELVLYPRTSAYSDHVLPEVPVPLDPYSEVVLPPKAYCPPEQAKIPTQEKEKIERTIPYTDDEMEDKIAAAIEDFDAHPERYEQPRQAEQKSGQDGNDSKSQEDGSNNNKRRRGRRRGGRNRKRDREPHASSQGPSPQRDAGRPKPEGNDEPLQKNKPSQDSERPTVETSQRPQRRGRSKPESNSQADLRPKSESKPKTAKKKVVKKAAIASKDSALDKTPAKKAPARKAGKKTAKKAVKKAVKKTATKKVAKKAVKRAK